MSPQEQILVEKAFKNLAMNLTITFPSLVKGVKPPFEKVNDNTVVFSYKADLVNNPDAMDKFNTELPGDGKIIIATQGLTFLPAADKVPLAFRGEGDSLAPETEMKEKEKKEDGSLTTEPQAKEEKKKFELFLGKQVRLSLDNGKVVQGRVMEQTDKEITIELAGISLTYYLDEVLSIIKISED
jgi:hypothetical protein